MLSQHYSKVTRFGLGAQARTVQMLGCTNPKTQFVQQQSVRAYHPQWLKKNFDVYKPTFHDDVVRRWDDRFKTNRRKVTQDPLFFDNKHDYINGGIKNLIEIMHEKVQYNIALNKMPIVFYNMAVTDHFDPKIYKELENQYKLSDIKWIEARHCYGALYGYYM